MNRTTAGLAVTGILMLGALLLPTAAGAWSDCSYSLYIANEGNGGGGTTVVRADCTGAITPYAEVLGASGLVFDPTTGELYASGDAPGIRRIDAAGNVLPVAESVYIENPNGLELDSLGRLLVADAGNRILRITLNPDGTAVASEVLAEGFSIPQGVVETAAGAVLFTDLDGYIYIIGPATATPVTPSSAATLPVGQVVPGNQGPIKLDELGNIYTADFGGGIVRVSPDGLIAKHVVDIPPVGCQPDQAGTVIPSFRGLVFDPDGNLVATGYCLDNIYIFDRAALDAAWDTNTPITELPPPFAQNPGGALDGADLNGPFGVAFWYADAEPPDAGTCSIERAELWPPNHKFVDVGLTLGAWASCDGMPPEVVISVSSDEDPALAAGSGGRTHCPDALIAEDGSVLLRSERAGTGDGRVYRITVTATDSCGNVETCAPLVGVPHDLGAGGDAVDSGQAFDPTICE